MSKREKLRRKLRNNPKDATLQELETLLIAFGFRLIRIKGSHHIYEYDDDSRVMKVVIPLHGRKVKQLYVKRTIELLDNFLQGQSLDEDGEDSNE